MSVLQRLDGVYNLAQVDRFDVAELGDELERELAGEVATLAVLAAREERVRAVLEAIDGFTARAMRIRLEHALPDETALGKPFRQVLATTIVRYERELDLLAERVAATTARSDPRRAPETTAAVVMIARRVLAVRAELRQRVLAVVSALARDAIPDATRGARDRTLTDDVRLQWSAARLDLEQVALRPERVLEARLADRIAALRAPDEAVEEAPQPTRGELLELD